MHHEQNADQSELENTLNGSPLFEGDCSSCDESSLLQEIVDTCESQQAALAEEMPISEASPSEPTAPVKVSAQVEALRKRLEGMSAGEKVEGYLGFMKEQLNPSNVNFRDFWDARRDLSPALRAVEDATLKAMLAEKIQALCAEAKGLKNVLDEQSQFAVEQIELAIGGIEQELNQLDASVPHWTPTLYVQEQDFDLNFYAPRQGMLSWLNSFSSRVGALRKELMKTEMRVRSKNKLFASLSAVGDRIFPKRKELIREISETFTRDVENYTHHLLNATNVHILSTKDEVKAWQGLAKELTLNTHAFKKTREQLSQCWEFLKKMDKEFHQQRHAQRGEKKEQFNLLQQQLDEIKKLHEAGQLNERLFVTKLDELVKKIKKDALLREDSDAIREQVRTLKQPIIDREDAARAQENSRLQAISLQRDLQVQAVMARFEELVQGGLVESISAMQHELRQLQERVVLSQDEKNKLHQAILELQNRDFEREIESLLKEAESAKLASSDMLKKLFDLRSKLRLQLEEHKRAAGASGMDFERAMVMSQRAKFEKERIERIEQAIAKLQSKGQ